MIEGVEKWVDVVEARVANLEWKVVSGSRK